MKSNFYGKYPIKSALSAIILFCAILMVQSCMNLESDFEKLQKEQDEKIQKFLSVQGLNAEKSERGLYFLAQKENSEGKKIENGNIVTVYYTLRSLGGTKIESLEEDSEESPLKVRHGKGAFVPFGADFILSKMRVGERYRVIIPSYAEPSEFNIPHNVSNDRIIDLEIEVVEVITSEEQAQLEDELLREYIESKEITDLDTLADGLYYKRLIPGNGDKPRNGNRVHVHYTGRLLNDKVFDSTKDKPSFKFFLGEASVIKGWDRGILRMSKHEKGILYIPSHLGYGEFPASNLRGLGVTIPKKIEGVETIIPAFSPLVFEVELVDF